MKDKLKRIIPLCVLISAFIFTTLIFSSTYAKFTSNKEASGSVPAASVAFGGEQLEFEVVELAPGESITYKFKVTNKDGSTVSEVAQKYSISVSSMGNLPFTYSLSEATVTGGGNGVTALDTQDGTMTEGTECVHTYILTITWDSAQNDASYANEIDVVTVTVDAVQVQPAVN